MPLRKISGIIKKIVRRLPACGVGGASNDDRCVGRSGAENAHVNKTLTRIIYLLLHDW